MPEVSIIVPCYNAETTIERCVDSILRQTHKDFELVLVNDGSKDRTGEIIDCYANQDSRIVAIHKPNGGVSTARNAALDIACGEYIAFADADDEVKPEWIETFLSIISGKDLAVQGIDFIGQGTLVKSIGISSGCDNRTLVSRLMRYSFLGYMVGKMFKQEIIKQQHIRFDPTIKFREDDVFMLNYAVHLKNWASTDKSNYIYYVPSGDKEYGTNATDCTEQIFNSLNIIIILRFLPVFLRASRGA